MAARMSFAVTVSDSAFLRSFLSRRTTSVHSPSPSLVPGRKLLLGDPILLSPDAPPSVSHTRGRRAPLAVAVLSMLPASLVFSHAPSLPPYGESCFRWEDPQSHDGERMKLLVCGGWWSARAVKSFCMAEQEARKFKCANTGTEALFMGILVEGDEGEVTTIHLLLGIWSEKDSAGHKILASLGFDDEKAGELAKSISVVTQTR